MKTFTSKDLEPGLHPRIFVEKDELIIDELPWQKQGLQQTASGYGAKLTSRYKISYNGKIYRIYTTIFSNAGSSWFSIKGKKIFVD